MSSARRRWVSLVGLCLMVTVFAAPRAEARTITLNFTDLDEILFGSLGNEDLDFVITNSTGVTWTDFHLRSRVIGGFTVDDYVGPGTATYLEPIGTQLGTQFSFGIDIVGISIASGGTLSFSQSTFCGIAESCSLGNVIAAQPTTDARPPDDDPPTGVPEPSSLVLLATALGAMGVHGKRQRRVRG